MLISRLVGHAILLCTVLMHAENVSGERICMQMEAADAARLVPQALRQAATGKKGPKGDVGPPGRPGRVKFRRIKEILDKSVTAEAAEMKSTISSLKNSTQTLQTENMKMRESIRMWNRTEVAKAAEMKSTISLLKNSTQTLQTENEKMREEIRMWNRTEVAKAAEMKSTISSLKNSIQTLETENEKMREDIRMLNRTKVTRGCKEAELSYDGYCFWFDITERTFSQAESKRRCCHSTVGYILDSTHYDMMLVELRRAIPEGYSASDFWLGLRQDPTTGTVTKISDGLKAPYLKWKTDNPEPDRRSFDTNVYLRVHKDASSNSNGMGDRSPNNSKGVICQYKSL